MLPKGQRLKEIPKHNYATKRLYDATINPNIREFRGVDGEGGNVPEEGTLFGSRHQYLSLRIGPDLLQTGRPLSWRECFAFLTDRPANKYIYVAYFFDYDVTMMIRTLPAKVASILLNRHLRNDPNERGGFTKPVSYGGYQFDYLPHKEFKIRRDGQRHWIVINDVGQFFQSTFLSALEKWNIGTPEEREFIRKGKSMRADFAEHTQEIEYYNTLEVLLLEQLMTDFRQVCLETGYVPKKWQGPGNLASAMLDAHHIPRRDTIPILENKSFYDLALAAYYGGRFETTAAGPVHGPIYQYDINSAYPALLRTLPCLTHGSWKQVRQKPESGLWFGRISFTHEKSHYLYNLPFRDKKGNICYPRRGIGVYWSTEIEAAESAGTDMVFHEGWIYEQHCKCQWFDFIDAYYEKRLKLGKTTKGYVLKLAGNSIYGKLAQSIGYAPWANPVWAGLITAGCRAMLVSAYNQAPGHCYMLATDGLFTDVKLDLPVSKKLGEWDETIHPDGMFIVQPGLYFIGDDAKSRGVERGRIYSMRPEFEKCFKEFIESHGVLHPVKVPVTNFITARQAIARNKWKLAGVWEKTVRDIVFDWQSKRAQGLMFVKDGNYRTYPPIGNEDAESQPYARRIGGGVQVSPEEKFTSTGLADAADFAEQPDWAELPY